MEIGNAISNGKIELSSKTIILFDGQADVEFSVDFKPQFRGKRVLKFQFEEDEKINNGDTFLKSEAKDEIIILHLYNIDNPLGVGLKNPLPILESAGKKIYLLFDVRRPEKNMPRILTFTIYADK